MGTSVAVAMVLFRGVLFILISKNTVALIFCGTALKIFGWPFHPASLRQEQLIRTSTAASTSALNIYAELKNGEQSCVHESFIPPDLRVLKNPSSVS